MINRKSICDGIIDSIIQKIRDHELKPGDKLPNEVDMAEEYGVSRISLREALKSLAARGLIVTKHGEGSFINDYDPEMVAETICSVSLLNDAPILEMLQLRKIMETEAAKLCAVNASDKELATIEKYKKGREKYCNSPKTPEYIKKKYEMDKLFHLSIAKGSHNEIFIKFIETIHTTIDIHQKLSAVNSKSIQDSTYYHNEIFNAIKAHDAEKAGQMMYAHLANVETSFKTSANK
jgi:GntR family transcriptional repressor for pyruvate dehydrogenase complex